MLAANLRWTAVPTGCWSGCGSRGGPVAASQFAECLWELLEQHFTYRLILELDQVVLWE